MRAFALAAFAVSGAAQLYFLLWLQGWLVPGIDDGRAWPVAGALAWNVALVLGFGALHSLMARPAFKARWTRVVPVPAERSAYILVAGITLALLCHAWAAVPAPVWGLEAGWARALAWAGFGAGVLLLLASIAAIDPLHFNGLRQAFSGCVDDPPFAVRGPYRLVRHPIQAGLLLIVWSTPEMSVGHLQLALLFTAYSVAATLGFEERDLRRALGAEYEAYRSRVPALLPWPRPRG